MRKICFVLIILSLFLSSVTYANPLQPGDSFPDIKLEGKLSAEHEKYLGLSGAGPWNIQDINADYIIIEVYSMYCPHCQKEAPAVNSFCNLLNKSEKCADVKFFGLAAGNSEFEVDFYRKKFSVEFPLFTDTDLDLHSDLGAPGTPHFFMLKKEGKKFKVILSHAGPFESAEKFLKAIKDKL
ncbi:TlpA disulfide reductase family protein [Desulfovibrio sp. JC010]|uniref:TlpA family protein disulfide reductase n=1 Tax=Desulfovibrio sp. JC010 TaxID=2593641 RepID=UPI0013D2928E|nr:TlpA disulfide reductase family protein [Desulfovibrio sp. JC010]NDV25929.1 TlpA family protein disulfide reductase [Desulfovibrio sp. JC010]